MMYLWYIGIGDGDGKLLEWTRDLGVDRPYNGHKVILIDGTDPSKVSDGIAPGNINGDSVLHSESLC